MKRQRKKLIIINYCVLISLISIYKSLEYILKLNNLAYMNIVIEISIAAFAILFILLLIQIIIVLFSFAKKKTIKLSKRIAYSIAAAVIIKSILLSFVCAPILYMFIHKPEYIVEKDGHQTVAYTRSYLKVNVYYYDYVNYFVRGEQLKIEELADAGYDPLKNDQNEVIWYTYYDDNGKIIKSNR